MIELLKRVAEVKKGLDGGDWCDRAKTEALVSMVIAFRPPLIVEVGVFGGGSLIPMAMAIQHLGGGAVVVGIDPWSDAIAIQGQVTNEDREWWAAISLDRVYDKFISKIRELGLEAFTQIHRKTSDAVDIPAGIAILHIDGSHDDQAVRDVAHFAPRVELGGFCVMDDLHWANGGPKRGAQRLVQMGFKERYSLGTGACFQRCR